MPPGWAPGAPRPGAPAPGTPAPGTPAPGTQLRHPAPASQFAGPHRARAQPRTARLARLARCSRPARGGRQAVGSRGLAGLWLRPANPAPLGRRRARSAALVATPCRHRSAEVAGLGLAAVIRASGRRASGRRASGRRASGSGSGSGSAASAEPAWPPVSGWQPRAGAVPRRRRRGRVPSLGHTSGSPAPAELFILGLSCLLIRSGQPRAAHPRLLAATEQTRNWILSAPSVPPARWAEQITPHHHDSQT